MCIKTKFQFKEFKYKRFMQEIKVLQFNNYCKLFDFFIFLKDLKKVFKTKKKFFLWKMFYFFVWMTAQGFGSIKLGIYYYVSLESWEWQRGRVDERSPVVSSGLGGSILKTGSTDNETRLISVSTIRHAFLFSAVVGSRLAFFNGRPMILKKIQSPSSPLNPFDSLEMKLNISFPSTEKQNIH